MKHARKDYMRIQDPDGKIPEDEPVFLLRAQDELAPDIVSKYAEAYLETGGNPDVYKKLIEHANLMFDWQAKVKVQHPTIPSDQMV